MYTRSEQRVMDILKETCRNVESGYELGLLWKANRPLLPDDFDTALKRLESIERRLQRYPRLSPKAEPRRSGTRVRSFARKD